MQYFGKRFLSPYLNRWVSADPLAVHVPGKADFNLYAYVSGAVLKSVDPVGLCADQDACIQGDFRTSDVPEVRAIGDSNHPPASDQDKVADSLGVPREQNKNGLPTAEAIDHARQGLPSSLQQDSSLKPTGNGQGIQGWTTESGGTKRQYTPTGDEAGYAGEKPAERVMSPIDFAGPAAMRGIWMLGGRALRLAEAAPISASAARAAPSITSGSQVTEGVIREAMKDAPLVSQQAGGVSLPRVQQYVDRLLAGEAAPAIKVDGQMLVDGNHRYIAGRILGQEPPIQPWAGGRPWAAVSWDKLPISPESW